MGLMGDVKGSVNPKISEELVFFKATWLKVDYNHQVNSLETTHTMKKQNSYTIILSIYFTKGPLDKEKGVSIPIQTMNDFSANSWIQHEYNPFQGVCLLRGYPASDFPQYHTLYP